jgi:hypothetical protein
VTFAIRDEAATVRLSDEPGRAALQITHLVKGIGDDSLFVILFKWPENVSKFEYAEPDQNFLQVTGTQDGLTVELMRNGRLFTVGHTGGEPQPTSLRRQDGTAIEVNQNEKLSTDEAVDLFTGYLETESLDETAWVLREIPLGAESEVADSGTSSAGVSDAQDTSHAAQAGRRSRTAGDGGVGDDTGKAQS